MCSPYLFRKFIAAFFEKTENFLTPQKFSTLDPWEKISRLFRLAFVPCFRIWNPIENPTDGARETTLYVMPMGTMGAVTYFMVLCQKFWFFANLNPFAMREIDALFTEGVVPLDASIGEKIGL
jgi:hypothetical protein